MSSNQQKSIRLIILALLIAMASFGVGAVSVLKYLSWPSSLTGINNRFFSTQLVAGAVINGYQSLVYDRVVWNHLKWLGVPILKYPEDLFVYQEMIYQLKPNVILDIGTFNGGSALYYATLFDLMKIDSGRVISVDIERKEGLPNHPRITYLLGSSTSDAILKQIKELIRPGEKVMAFLDSDHTAQNVLKELRAYSQIVTKGSYLVVEDSNINGHPVHSEFGPGPMEAIHEFLNENTEFQIDKSREKFLLTVAPDGFLLKL